jgi:hypothetical protein
VALQAPKDSLESIRIEIIQFLNPDGSVGWRFSYPPDAMPSQIIGLLTMAQMEMYLRVKAS